MNADRVASLRDQMAQHTHQVADLKQQSDAQAQQLSADKTSFLASEQAANQSATAVAAARSGTQAQLSQAQGQVADLQHQIEAQRAAVGTGAGAPAYLGGPYSIPTYIVMCESGGNYHALNASSGAGGAYQILPSTWAAYGGQGARRTPRRRSRTGSPRRSGATRARAPGPAPSNVRPPTAVRAKTPCEGPFPGLGWLRLVRPVFSARATPAGVGRRPEIASSIP